VDRRCTSGRLDVHARSVVACGVDARTAEVFERRLTPDHAELLGWLRSLPGPVAVTYEAGPTGFGLARFLAGEGEPNSPSCGNQPANIRLTTRREPTRSPPPSCTLPLDRTDYISGRVSQI
jgi:transposase